MELSENRRKIERWLDLLDGGRAANRGWGLIVMGLFFSVLWSSLVEQERPGKRFAVLAYLLIGALVVLRVAVGLMKERHETLAMSLCLLSTAGRARYSPC